MNNLIKLNKQQEVQQEQATIEINRPDELLLKPITDLFKENKELFRFKNYRDTINLTVNKEYKIPFPFPPFMVFDDCIYSTKLKGSKLSIKLAAGFTVQNARYIRYITNPENFKEDELYIAITLKCYNGKIIEDILLKSNAKYDEKEFQKALGSRSNYALVNLNTAELKTFMQIYIFPLLDKEYRIYKKAGLIEPQTFLCKNCLIYNGETYYADNDSFIRHPFENCYVKISDDFEYSPPILYFSEKNGKTVAYELLRNYCESLGENLYLHLFILGHMSMGLHYKSFTKDKLGAPIPLICGVTSAGKSVTSFNGISIFGLNEDLMASGDSTLYGQEGIANAFIGVSLITDDLSESILESRKFSSNIKKLFKSSKRYRRKDKGQKGEKIEANSQVGYSTNGALPEIPELINRSNIYTFLKGTIDENKFQYFPENAEKCKELSLILVELLKYSKNDVLKIHTSLLNVLKEKFPQPVYSRILHNVAYMWTGITILEEIADYKIPGLVEAVANYTKMSINKVKTIPTPVDLFLQGLLIMKHQEIIRKDRDYIIKEPQETESGFIELRFHKETLLNIYNNFFRNDAKYKLNVQVFSNYLSVDKRLLESTTQRYLEENGKRGKGYNSTVLNITDWEDVLDFAGVSVHEQIKAMDYSEFQKNLKKM